MKKFDSTKILIGYVTTFDPRPEFLPFELMTTIPKWRLRASLLWIAALWVTWDWLEMGIRGVLDNVVFITVIFMTVLYFLVESYVFSQEGSS